MPLPKVLDWLVKAPADAWNVERFERTFNLKKAEIRDDLVHESLDQAERETNAFIDRLVGRDLETRAIGFRFDHRQMSDVASSH